MKRWLSVLLCLCLLLPLAGCGGKADGSFTAVLPGNVRSLDPQTATGEAARRVIASMFEGLCRVGPDSEAEPGVAKRWEHNADYTRFTFHLRKTCWSDGSAVTAADFVFGVTRALDPALDNDIDVLLPIRGARQYRLGLIGPEELGVQATDDRTLVVTLEAPCPDFPLLTADMRYMPCQQAYFERCEGHYGLSSEFLLTNGPFTFPHIYAWNTDYNERKLSLTRAVDYRGERKVLPLSLTWLIDYDDAIDRDPVSALENGDVDLLPLTAAQAEDARARGLKLLSLDDGVTGLLLNPDSDALSYVTTRELFLKTLDRQDLLDRGSIGEDTEAAGLFAPCVRWNGGDYYAQGDAFYPARDPEIVSLIPDLTKLLKTERIPSITVLCPDDPASIATANGILVAWNSQLGNHFNMEPLPEETLRARVAAGNYQAALYTLRSGAATPYQALDRLGDAFGLPDSDDMQALSATLTREAFRAAEADLVDAYLFYPLAHTASWYGLSPGTAEVTVSPDGLWNFTRASAS